MAILTPGRSKNRPGYFARKIKTYILNGQIVATSWPRRRGPHKLTWQKAAVERLRIGMKLIKTVSDNEQNTLRAALDAFVSKHGGLKSSSAIRMRDWLFANISGRSWAITKPNGDTVYPATVVRDMSDFLDTIEPRVGSMIVRGQQAWMTTSQPAPGGVFHTSLEGTVPQCAKAASVPDWREAVGGYPPYQTEGDILQEPPEFPNAHKYWRCRFTENNGGIRVNLAEMQYRDTPGGVDKAFAGEATASSQNTSSTGPEKAFDDDPVSRWVSTSSDWPGAWLAYEFTGPIQIRQFTIRYLQSPPASSAENAPKAWWLEYSDDGENWTAHQQYTDQTNWSFGELRTFSVEWEN